MRLYYSNAELIEVYGTEENPEEVDMIVSADRFFFHDGETEELPNGTFPANLELTYLYGTCVEKNLKLNIYILLNWISQAQMLENVRLHCSFLFSLVRAI